jgi:mono/diheme cytochrome c family protein
MIRRALPALALAALTLLPGCDVLPPIDFQRMIFQDRFQVWQHCIHFEDGMAMRTPPAGTLPRDAPIGGTPLTTGVQGDAYLTRVPLPVTRALLATGRARFETYCAPCHGLLGDGQSVVALNMDLRKPPALAGAAAHPRPDGRVYQIITEGYGLMRSYAEDLTSPEERWAVVAYLRALELSQGVPLSALPPDVRQEAERQLP